MPWIIKIVSLFKWKAGEIRL